MPTIHCTATSTVSPEKVLRALTDFSPDRPRLWPNLDPRIYEVHDTGRDWAEVTEGSSFDGGIWERARYDWSEPGTVRIAVLDSNAFAPGCSWTYKIDPVHGGSRVELEVVRHGRTLNRRALAGLLALTGRMVFCGDLGKTLAGLGSA